MRVGLFAMKTLTTVLLAAAFCGASAQEVDQAHPLERMRGWLSKEQASPSTIFTDASVKGPSSQFRTVVLSGDDHLIFAQYQADGSRIYAGADRNGGWQYDANAGTFSDLGPDAVAFLQAHDFHRTILAPTTLYPAEQRFSVGDIDNESVGNIAFKDAAGGTVELSIAVDSGRPLEIRYPDHRNGNVVRARPADWTEQGGHRIFRSLLIIQDDKRFEYNFQRVSVNLEPLLSPNYVETTSDAIALERFHHLDQLAHLAGDAQLFTSHFDDPITEISKGQIRLLSVADAAQRFERYFSNTSFLQWRDTEPASIMISSDGGHAHKLVRKEVIVAEPRQSFGFAWLESWDRKPGGSWRLTTIVSTQP